MSSLISTSSAFVARRGLQRTLARANGQRIFRICCTPRRDEAYCARIFSQCEPPMGWARKQFCFVSAAATDPEQAEGLGKEGLRSQGGGHWQPGRRGTKWKACLNMKMRGGACPGRSIAMTGVKMSVIFRRDLMVATVDSEMKRVKVKMYPLVMAPVQ